MFTLCLYLPISDEADRIEITEHPQAEIEIEARVNETITLKCQAHNTFGKELDYQWFKDNKKGMLVVPCGLSSHLR